jgi:hypothetical protein
MAETRRIRVYYEGDDDRVILQGLQRMTLLPDAWEIAIRTKQHPGKDGLVRELLPFVAPVNGVGGSAVVLVDLDDLSAEGMAAWFQRQLAEGVKNSEPPMTLSREVPGPARVTFVHDPRGRSDRKSRAGRRRSHRRGRRPEKFSRTPPCVE